MSFSVAAVGAIPLHYQWYSNSVAIANATNTGYTVANAQPANATVLYNCVVTNSAGTITSRTAFVTILPIPSVIPYSQVVLADKPVSFWPLNETNNPNSGVSGLAANDLWGGNNGIYTNADLAQPGFNPTIDTNGTAVLFGSAATWDSDVYGIPTAVDFSAPNGASGNFSVEAWVQGTQQQTLDAGLVSKGYGGGGEQWDMDCGSSPASYSPHNFRFFVRDASGVVHGINSVVNPNDGLWHHLAGVCNETNGEVIFYIDGLPVGTSAITPGSGVLASTRSMLIGSRPSNSTTNSNDAEFAGNIQDVAVYNYALSPAQVLNHYNSGDIPATIAVAPASVTCSEFGTAVFTPVVVGTPPVGYQWYDGSTSLAIPGATNAVFVTNNVPQSSTGASYYLVVTNYFGTNTSPTVSVTVDFGLPQVTVPSDARYFVPAGGTISIPITVMGTLPMTNQWQVSDTNAVSWTNLTDNVRITGSQLLWPNMTNVQASVLTIANAKLTDAGDYQLVVGNSYGAVTSTIANLVVGTLPLGFNGDGVGWTTNGSASAATNQLTLTDDTGGITTLGNGSFFFQYPQYIGAFKASFRYQDVDMGGADGATFCIQNDPRGAAALGGGGGGLGYSGITPSIALELNLYNGNTQILGWAVMTNGLTGAGGANGNYTPFPATAPNNINLNSGDPIDISVLYVGGNLSLMFTDSVQHVWFGTNLNVGSLPQLLGSQTAYVGFSGAYGGVHSLQIITNFTFVSLPSAMIQPSGTNVTVSWPGAVAGYGLQQNNNLTTTNWITVTNADVIAGGLHQITIPATSSNAFYRLSLQP